MLMLTRPHKYSRISSEMESADCGKFFGKELQSDVAAEFEVFGVIHNSHPAAADLAENAVMGNRLPHGLGGRGHWREW